MAIEQWRITDRAEWLLRRQADVTASDLGALAGIDEFRSPLRVFMEKTGQILSDPANKAMIRGIWLEPAVLKAVQDTKPDWEVKPAHVYLRDPDIRLGATPDSFAVDPTRPGIGNLQLKVVSRPTFERDWANGVPLKYQLQTLAEAMLAECEWAAIAALVLDTYTADIVVREVPRHQKAEERIRAIAVEFWEMIANGQQPAPNFRQDAELLKVMYPKGGTTPPIDLSTHNRIGFLAEEHMAWAKRRRTAEDAQDEVDAEIHALLGDHDEALHPDYKITWRLQKRGEVILPPVEFRTLRISRKKSE